MNAAVFAHIKEELLFCLLITVCAELETVNFFFPHVPSGQYLFLLSSSILSATVAENLTIFISQKAAGGNNSAADSQSITTVTEAS